MNSEHDQNHQHDNPLDNPADPLVRIGQGEYARDLYPHDFEDPPIPDAGACAGLLVAGLSGFALGLVLGFLMGLLLGGWRW
jgi:hypothetical protein